MGQDVQDRSQGTIGRRLFDAALAAVSAEACLPQHLPPVVPGRSLIVAVGKAAAAMAQVALAYYGEATMAIVLVPHGHGLMTLDAAPGVTQIEAAHPIPDEAGAHAAHLILREVGALGPADRLLALISGGGSALLAMPADGVRLQDKKRVTRDLLRCGASIGEINCVRKHLSRIKGGRLARAAYPARVVTLAISDIPGDDPALIASGPTVFDATTLADARAILARYDIAPPTAVAAALADPANETPDADPDATGETRVVARASDALAAAARLADALGYTVVDLGDAIEGDAAELGQAHGALALDHARRGGRWALLSGGETTVVVSNPNGRGGRNTHYLLSLALGLDGADGIHSIACDTDGIDGSEDNAGATIAPDTLARAAALGLDGRELLQTNRAYDVFAALGDLVVTGPTRTNVNDFRAILIDR